MKLPLSTIYAIEAKAGALLQSYARSITAESLTIEAQEPEPMRIERGVAVIPIKGVLSKEPDIFMAFFGGTSTQDIAQSVTSAAADESVLATVLLVDSPGGSVDGMAEASDAIFKARQVKPVIAQVVGMAASAAFMLASQADKVFAQRMDMIGSIGATATLFDMSEAFKRDGVETLVIDTGEFKTAGEIGTVITARQKADFQRIVDGFFEDFLATVARGRDITADKVRESADGKMFFAPDAIKRGLIDGIQTWDVTLAGLLSEHRPLLEAAKRSTPAAF